MKKHLVFGLILVLFALLAAGPALAKTINSGGMTGADINRLSYIIHYPACEWEQIDPPGDVALRIIFMGSYMHECMYLNLYDVASGDILGSYLGRLEYWHSDLNIPSDLMKLVIGQPEHGAALPNLSGRYLSYSKFCIDCPDDTLKLALPTDDSSPFARLSPGGEDLTFRLVSGPHDMNFEGHDYQILEALKLPETRSAIEAGMVAVYTGQVLEIQGFECFEVVLGDWPDSGFIPQVRYAVHPLPRYEYFIFQIFRFEPLEETWIDLSLR